MTKHLQDLLEAAKKFVFTSEDKEQQRRSFAYGNTVMENPRITREMIDRAAFPAIAAKCGSSVAKPWGEGERYDIIVRVENVCWRVQVKSVLAKTPSKPHYRIKTATGGGAHSRIILYWSTEIDSLPLT
jgi:hypothetical protein